MKNDMTQPSLWIGNIEDRKQVANARYVFWNLAGQDLLLVAIVEADDHDKLMLNLYDKDTATITALVGDPEGDRQEATFIFDDLHIYKQSTGNLIIIEFHNEQK